MSNTTSFIPAAPPPTGEISDPLQRENTGHTAALALTTICAIVTNTLFVIHAYVKLRVKGGRLLTEDWFCIAAWIFTNILSGSMLATVHYGGGMNVWDISIDEYAGFLKWLYIAGCVYSPAAFSTKVTLLLLIARVFSVKPRISRGVKIFICAMAVAYLPVQGLKTFLCSPIEAFWDPTYADAATGKNPYCLDQAQLFMCDISIAIVTDLIILILPIPLVWSMRAPPRQKVKMIILLGAGGGATASTVVRAYYNVGFMSSTNVPADFASIIVTTMLELSTGFACVCLPSAKLMVDRATSSLNHPTRSWFGQDRPSRSDQKPASTVSTYWESIRSKMTTSTRPASITAGGAQSSRASPRWRRGRDVELGFDNEPVVFEQRLEVPSLRSTSDSRSCTSRGGDHRGLSDTEFAHCMSEISSQKGQGEDFSDSRGESFTDKRDLT